jgi:hypothetical protein
MTLCTWFNSYAGYIASLIHSSLARFALISPNTMHLIQLRGLFSILALPIGLLISLVWSFWMKDRTSINKFVIISILLRIWSVTEWAALHIVCLKNLLIWLTLERISTKNCGVLRRDCWDLYFFSLFLDPILVLLLKFILKKRRRKISQSGWNRISKDLEIYIPIKMYFSWCTV